MNRYLAHVIFRKDGSEFAQFPVFAEKPEWAIEQAQKALPLLFGGKDFTEYFIEVDEGERISKSTFKPGDA
jgi:hypothetical protein